MAIFRVNKTSDYTVMSNYHFKEKEMSLKAKGLLSEMLSLPDNWDYSISGLVAINKENETSIKNTLNELKKYGYLNIIKLLPNETKTGRIEYIYDVYENPKQEGEKQEVENLPLENQAVENQVQLNTNILNTKELNIKEYKEKYKKESKSKYGEYQNVLLTDKEYYKLCEDYNNIEEIIKFLDEYIEEKGYKSKSHNLAIRRWVAEAVKNQNIKRKDVKQYDRPAWLDMDL